MIFVRAVGFDEANVGAVGEKSLEADGVARGVPILTDADNVGSSLAVDVGGVVHATGGPRNGSIGVVTQAGGNAQALPDPADLLLVGERQAHIVESVFLQDALRLNVGECLPKIGIGGAIGEDGVYVDPMLIPNPEVAQTALVLMIERGLGDDASLKAVFEVE